MGWGIANTNSFVASSRHSFYWVAVLGMKSAQVVGNCLYWPGYYYRIRAVGFCTESIDRAAFIRFSIE